MKKRGSTNWAAFDAALPRILAVRFGSASEIRLWPQPEGAIYATVGTAAGHGQPTVQRVGLILRRALRGADVPSVLLDLRALVGWSRASWVQGSPFLVVPARVSRRNSERMLAHGVPVIDAPQLLELASQLGLERVVNKALEPEESSYEESLVEALMAISPGRDGAAFREYESLGERLVAHLLVPPLTEPRRQLEVGSRSRRPDLVLRNEVDHGFWKEIRQRCDAFSVVVDFKNYSDPLDPLVVSQFAGYLGERGMGRFGLLVSRCGLSSPAMLEQSDLWHRRPRDSAAMVVCIDDQDIREMLDLRANGDDPTLVIRRRYEAVIHA